MCRSAGGFRLDAEADATEIITLGVLLSPATLYFPLPLASPVRFGHYLTSAVSCAMSLVLLPDGNCYPWHPPAFTHTPLLRVEPCFR